MPLLKLNKSKIKLNIKSDFKKMFFFCFLASFVELMSCALNISLRNHGNQDKRNEGGL